MIRQALSFIKKDFLEAASYRTAFIFSIVASFFSVCTYFFVAKLFGGSVAPFLKPYGGDYFSFALIGIAFVSYLGFGLQSFTGYIRDQIATGTLEAMLVTPTRLSVILVFSNLWGFIFTTLHVLIYLLFGVLLFGLNLHNANIIGALIVLFLSVITFSGIGIMSASFIIVFKRGDPINWLMSVFSSFIGGVYFPVTVLPAWISWASYFFPVTYAMRAMRFALLQGYPLSKLFGDIAALIIFSIIIIPLSYFSFKWAVRKAKMEGSLIQY